jgi:ABC-2 type transport system ATP-binding protein
MQTKIIISELNKFYGKKHALKDINLTIHQGMFGLLGRNGAGKTTLMRILSTLLRKDSGAVSICGIPIDEASHIRQIIGYMPQDFNFYPNMTVYEALEYLGILSGTRKESLHRRIPDLLDQVNLGNERKKKIRELSGGMRQRLGIAQSMMHNPKILITDEPTSGLDPMERVRFRNMLQEFSQDRIVILSTHIVSDIEAVCENVAILNEGALSFQGTINELLAKTASDKVEDAYIKLMEGCVS